MSRYLAAERFWSKVEFTGSCWLWVGARNTAGYGNFYDGTRTVKAHRWAYEFCVGPVPEGLQLDHLCRVRNCITPDHLEPVTNHENLLRGEGPTGRKARQTHCIHGHAFTPQNTYIKKGNGCRACLACMKQREAQRIRIWR